ncbi:Hsp70 protein-domain-containing protein [Phakopsora pachyrhizi]|uniref:Hsp70 protein-domain-containing protein n=1 Tax=Phakopsora pachyrhizi TaxID=170000 RepID=A0AAV0AIQ2_PHAPC|nr:Hsp70 protein-domain-containing protein [Phakopsora pachyrhizi]CAH7667674.1 Hsp70 protein-domain-containing protein [Phakopsora pachyrhizi]
MRLFNWALILSVSCLGWIPNSLARGILAIDYGTQFMKLSLVQPGIPFDVLLNHDSKRKTQSVVSIRGDDKLVGDDAATSAGRYPQNSYAAIKLLLGQPQNSPAVKFHQSLYNIPLESTPRGTVRFLPQLPKQGNNTISYLPEELMALQFSYARELADAASAANSNPAVKGIGGEKINDCIITVPGFFNQFERKAILDGAELAGLRVISLIDDGASVGVNYAMMRTFGNKKLDPSRSDAGPGVETHVIYDVGASSIKSTVIEFSMFEEKIHSSSKIKKNVTMLDVKGFGFERGLGGLTFDLKIRDHLKQEFETQTKLDVSKNDRAMVKLLREATRVKQVLSANVDSQSRIEGLVDDHDFKTVLSRQTFEEYFASDVSKFTQPIIDSLKSANLQIADIKSVILVGGSSRVPMIQAAVKSLVGESKVAVSVNADEAAVMGSALYGAGISRQFKTKDIRIKNISPHSVSAAYNVTRSRADPDHGKTQAQEINTVHTMLFDVRSRLGSKKSIRLRKSEDFSVVFSYNNQPDYFPASLLNVTIHGIASALANHTNVTGQEVPAGNASIKLAVQLDESALVVVSGATLNFSPKVSQSNGDESIANKIAGFFGSNNKKEEGSEEEQTEEISAEDEQSESKAEEKEKEKEKDSKSEVDKAKEALKAENKKDSDEAKNKKVEKIVVKLTVTRQELGIRPMSTFDRIASGKLLRELKAAEVRKKNKEEARNALEAYTYKLRDRLEQKVFQNYGSEEEIKTLHETKDEISDWLNDWAEQAPLKELKEKKKKLESAEQPFQQRIQESEKRPAAFKKLENSIKAGQLFGNVLNQTIAVKTSEPARYTEEEVTGLMTMILEQERWLEDMRNKTDVHDSRLDPPVKVTELESRGKMIEVEVEKLKQKKKPVKSKKSSKKSTTGGEPYSTKAEKSETTTDQKVSDEKVEPKTEEAKSDQTGGDQADKEKEEIPEGHPKDEL